MTRPEEPTFTLSDWEARQVLHGLTTAVHFTRRLQPAVAHLKGAVAHHLELVENQGTEHTPPLVLRMGYAALAATAIDYLNRANQRPFNEAVIPPTLEALNIEGALARLRDIAAEATHSNPLPLASPPEQA